ncbi:hypothetical protein BDR26DRAFT_859185 [Obelidium mucronatum]|nr:hypothetical protein BDR26DRAFT_859185 [Obelidium mucronatum]
MKEDEDILLVGLDAATAVGFAAEMFLEYFAEKCCEAATRDHRKTVAYKDMARTVREVSNLNFLEDLFPPMVTVKKAMDQKALLAKRAAAGNAAEDDEEELGLDEKNGEQADGEGIDNGADEDLRAQDDQEEEQYAAEEEEDEEDH